MINFFKRAFRQLRCRRAFARYSSAIACGVLATIPNASCSKKAEPQTVVISPSATKVDYDFTKMSTTVIYAQIFNMLIEPEAYENKIIKVKGNFAAIPDEATGKMYYVVLIRDATACCQEGIDFVWLGEHSYPQDYPPQDAEITITGRFIKTTLEDDITYCYLAATEVVF